MFCTKMSNVCVPCNASCYNSLLDWECAVFDDPYPESYRFTDPFWFLKDPDPSVNLEKKPMSWFDGLSIERDCF